LLLTFSVFESVKTIAEEWDAIIPAEHHLESKQLLILENAAIDDIEFRYLFIYNENKVKPAAAVYLQLINFRSDHYQAPLFNNIFLKEIEKRVMSRGFKMVICGNLFRIDAPGIFFDPKRISASRVMKAVQLYFRSLREKPHAIMVKDWQKSWETTWMKSNDYRLWPNDLTMKMDIDPAWETLEDYAGSLKHKYAQRLRKSRKKLIGVDCRELSLEEIIRLAPLMEELYMEVVQRQVIRMVIPGKEYFIEMKKAFREQFRVFGYFAGDQLWAFSSNVVYKDLWEMHYIGINYQQNEKHWLYFNLMYDAIDRAIQTGKNGLELGRTAREAKAILGGKPVYFTSFIHLNGAFVNLLVRIFAGRFNKKTGDDWQLRHPFKAQ
jgi:hypothetical protein